VALAAGQGAALDPGVAAALARLAADGLVAYPTETVWGLAAAAARPAAVARLRAWKGRVEDRALSLLVPDPAALDAFGVEPAAAARALAARFWPGPLTLVLHCSAHFADGVAARDGSVGFRCSPHSAAAALARAALAAGLGPLTATSLNRSGAPAARTRAEAAELCGDGPDGPALLEGAWPDAGGAAPSSVVDLTGPSPRLLREGALPARELLDAARSAARGEAAKLP
jgi:tRNA threonylcarbamoyl adenosine modification protein (Sua5/YciO/YrdC/YwlC family)